MTIADVGHDWVSFRAAVLTACESALGADSAATVVAWADGGRAFSAGRVLLTEVSDVVTNELDELNVPGQRLSESHDVTIQIGAESQHDDPSANALRLLSLIRFGLKRTSVRGALAAAGVAVVQFLPTQRLSYLQQGRSISAAAFDVTFRAAFVSGPDLAEDAGLIEHVAIAGAVEDETSADIDVDLGVINDPTPEP